MRRARSIWGFGVCALVAVAPASAQTQNGAGAGAGAGAAAAPFVATFVGPELAPGLDAAIPVRIADARTDAPAQAQVSAPRLVSPFGAVLPARLPPADGQVPGVRTFRGDLPTPGAWTLEFTLAADRRAPMRASVGFTVASAPARPFAADPAGPALTAAGPGVAPLGPAIVAPGPGARGEETLAPAAPSPSPTSGASSPAAAASSFCPQCAAAQPH